MTLILGHRGYSARYLENSMQAFRAALDAGMDGFELDVQPSRDGVCFILHDDDLARTAQSPGILRDMNSAELPLLKNGEPLPRLEDALQLPAKLINVELKGPSGWQLALRAVEHASALDRVIFSSFVHREIFELHNQRPQARCGLLFETAKVGLLSRGDVDGVPHEFTLHLPLSAILERPEFWSHYRGRLALWGLKRASDAASIPFRSEILISDGL